MMARGLVRDLGRSIARVGIYTIEYTSSEHRGIIMYAETHKATSPVGALAYAKAQLSDVAAKYGARGYRVKDADRVYNSNEGATL